MPRRCARVPGGGDHRPRFRAAQGRTRTLAASEAAATDRALAELRAAAARLAPRLHDAGVALQHVEVERLLVDGTSPVSIDARWQQELASERAALFGDEPPLAVEARQRYRWIRDTLAQVETPGSRIASRGAALVDWINRPWPATGLFILAMAVVFQAVFAWATPFMDLIDAGVSGVGAWLTSVLPPGMLTSFAVDGVVAGVGSVLIFCRRS